MFEQYRRLISSQFEAAFLTLKECIDSCPESAWHQPVCNHEFCQSAFHALFWSDLYLGPNMEAVKDQEFHRQHAEAFAGYEELEKKEPEKQYSRDFINEYFQHCHDKAKSRMAEVTDEQLLAPSGFHWIKGPEAEVHVYNIRHIQHHAAQLSLRLRLDSHAEVDWQRGAWPAP